MVQSVEELNDAPQHFMLYYCNDVSKMKAANKAKKRQQQGEDQQEEHDEEPETLKHATRKSGYTICVDAGLSKWIFYVSNCLNKCLYYI